MKHITVIRSNICSAGQVIIINENDGICRDGNHHIHMAAQAKHITHSKRVSEILFIYIPYSRWHSVVVITIILVKRGTTGHVLQ